MNYYEKIQKQISEKLDCTVSDCVITMGAFVITITGRVHPNGSNYQFDSSLINFVCKPNENIEEKLDAYLEREKKRM